MKLEQVTDKSVQERILEKFFDYDPSPGAGVMVHAIRVGMALVGYVATEDMGPVGGPHIYIYPEHRKRDVFDKLQWIFKQVYCPLMKALGKQYLVSAVDQDSGAEKFVEMLGFDVRRVTIAERKL